MKRTTAMILAASLAAATQLAAQTTNWNAGVPYAYDDAGNIARIGTDSHVYDWAGRLIQSETNAVQRKFEYDAFGNRKSCLQAGGTDCQWAQQVNPANNRLAGAGYDPAGNVTQFDGHSYTYDAFNMQTGDVYGVVAREYIYTADDERIAVYTPGSGSWRWTLREASGKVLRELTSRDVAGSPSAGSWTWVKDYVYRDGLLLASRQLEQGAPTTYHYHLDHLGTPRRVTDASDLIVGQHNYHAFGPELAQGRLDEPSQTPLKYTGHERDGDLDYMHARYYDMKMGRFLSVDPGKDWDPKRPQSWNMYAYVRNNPVNATDPNGRQMKPKKEACTPDNCPNAPQLDSVLRLTPENIERTARANANKPPTMRSATGTPPTAGAVTVSAGVTAGFVALGGGSVNVSVMRTANRIGPEHSAVAASGGVHTVSPRASIGVQGTFGIFRGVPADQRGPTTETNFTIGPAGVSLVFTKAGGLVGVTGSYGPSFGAGYSTSESGTVVLTGQDVLNNVDIDPWR